MCRLRKVSDEKILIFLEKEDITTTNWAKICSNLIKETSINFIALDLQNIGLLNNDFFEQLFKLSNHKKISICNLSTENMALVYLMKLNNFVDLFISKQDLLTNKNRLVKRNFVLCS